MACENPILIRNPRYNDSNIDYWRDYFKRVYDLDFLPDRGIEVPCGVCSSCKRSRLAGYRLRLLYEFEKFPNSLFITLTFNERFYRLFKSDFNRSVRLFLDRLRKRYGKGIKHFIIGEYGESTERFHYHGILYNFPINEFDSDEFESLWSYGWATAGMLRTGGINYVVKYITKDDPRGLKPPRLIVSKGLGLSFLESPEAKHARDNRKNYISSGGKIVPLPRYYLTKLYDYDERILNQLCSKLEPFKRSLNGKTYYDEREYRDALKRYSQFLEGLQLTQKPQKKIRTTAIAPILSHEVRELSPWDDYDFNTKCEKAIIDSCFDLNLNNPF